MATILPFTTKSPAKLGFERVTKRRKDLEQRGQMNLFSSPGQGRILRLPSAYGAFEEGLLLDERGDARAADAYRRAIAEEDCIADAYCNLGVLESQAGKTAEAFESFTQSLKHDPRHFESHYNLGNLYFESGDLRLAKVHYELASELSPSFPNVHFNLGLVHALNEDLERAIESLNRYKELTPEDEGRKADGLLDTLKRSVSIKRPLRK